MSIWETRRVRQSADLQVSKKTPIGMLLWERIHGSKTRYGHSQIVGYQNITYPLNTSSFLYQENLSTVCVFWSTPGDEFKNSYYDIGLSTYYLLSRQKPRKYWQWIASSEKKISTKRGKTGLEIIFSWRQQIWPNDYRLLLECTLNGLNLRMKWISRLRDYSCIIIRENESLQFALFNCEMALVEFWKKS